MTGQGAMSPFDIFQMSHYDEYMHQNSQSAFLPLGIINLRLLRVWSRILHTRSPIQCRLLSERKIGWVTFWSAYWNLGSDILNKWPASVTLFLPFTRCVSKYLTIGRLCASEIFFRKHLSTCSRDVHAVQTLRWKSPLPSMCFVSPPSVHIIFCERSANRHHCNHEIYSSCRSTLGSSAPGRRGSRRRISFSQWPGPYSGRSNCRTQIEIQQEREKAEEPKVEKGIIILVKGIFGILEKF